jgi:hypothetical protein
MLMLYNNLLDKNNTMVEIVFSSKGIIYALEARVSKTESGLMNRKISR